MMRIRSEKGYSVELSDARNYETPSGRVQCPDGTVERPGGAIQLWQLMWRLAELDAGNCHLAPESLGDLVVDLLIPEDQLGLQGLGEALLLSSLPFS